MKIDTNQLLSEIEDVLADYPSNVTPNTDDELTKAASFNMRSLACIERIMGPSSTYGQRAQSAVNLANDPRTNAIFVRGTLEGLRADVARGYITSLQERIHADLFSDYLEMAEYLLSDGYKDPAAVLVGGTLEEHIRQLCAKYSIDITDQSQQGARPKKTETMNSDLCKANVYSLLEQKQITAWLGLRNKAAHGEYHEYTKEQVVLFLHGLRNFIINHPA